jgi:ribosomal protein S18 acetylase RimI-like enzyme
MSRSSSPAIRRATDADLAAVGRLGARLLRVHYEFDKDRFMVPGADADEGYAWFLGTQLREDDALVLVAERGRDIVGYLYAGIEPRNWKELREEAAFVHDILVAEGHRNEGIAEALMAEALGWARSRGAPRVMLWTASPNERARRLFERLGFRATMIEMTRELT